MAYLEYEGGKAFNRTRALERWKVSTENITPRTLFQNFNIDVPRGAKHSKVIASALKCLDMNAARTDFETDDGGDDFVRVRLQGGGVIECRKSN